MFSFAKAYLMRFLRAALGNDERRRLFRAPASVRESAVSRLADRQGRGGQREDTMANLPTNLSKEARDYIFSMFQMMTCF